MKNVVERSSGWDPTFVYHNHCILTLGKSFIYPGNVNQVSTVWEFDLEAFRNQIAIGRVVAIEGHLTS